MPSCAADSAVPMARRGGRRGVARRSRLRARRPRSGPRLRQASRPRVGPGSGSRALPGLLTRRGGPTYPLPSGDGGDGGDGGAGSGTTFCMSTAPTVPSVGTPGLPLRRFRLRVAQTLRASTASAVSSSRRCLVVPLSRVPSRSRLLAAGAALAAAGGLAAVAAPVQAAPDHHPARPGPVAALSPAARQRLADLAAVRKIRGPFGKESRGRTSVFVQFTGTGAADAAGRFVARGNREAAARSRRAAVGRTADRVLATAHGKDSGARKIFEVANAVPGMGIRADDAAITAMARRFDVAKITPIPRHTVSNASAAQLTRVLSTWRSVGDTGRGVTIGVIDTGLDYTHSDFGGRGTTKAYDAALADETDPNWRDALPALGRAKVVGGFDFVGNAYDAGSYDPALKHPRPDPNPIDCGEHGTHVAGTAAGYGVTGNGHTFTGAYSRLTGSRLDGMRVGPGMAPRARLYPLKVFGCEGQTDMVIPALDKALDPNGDGDFSDHLDIVNLSLGTDYGPVDDPENDFINELTRHGVLAVASMGNNGDLTDTGGAPGNAVSSLAVASSVDAMQLRDGLRVNAPASVRGIAAGQASDAFDWAHARRVTGDVVAIPGANADGCDSLSRTEAAAVAGKVAWLEWDDNDATRRCGSVARSANVKAAGAIGAIFTSTLDVFNAGIAGDADIPVLQLPKSQTTRLRPAMNASTLNVTFDGSLIGTIRDVTPSITDTISSFTSRGPHGSVGAVKPDVTAPGDTITSAGMGSGNNQLTISGTSMASPHTAGIAALVKSRHTRWSPRAVKAAVMNTAVHDLFTQPARKGRHYGPARVGAGRVDAQRAVNTKVLAYVAGDNNPVSAS